MFQARFTMLPTMTWRTISRITALLNKFSASLTGKESLLDSPPLFMLTVSPLIKLLLIPITMSMDKSLMSEDREQNKQVL